MNKQRARIFSAFFVAFAAMSSLSASAQVTVFANKANPKRRIPSIVRLNDGRLLAFADNRLYKDTDIGGNVPIGVDGSYSADNGLTWDAPFSILRGNMGATDYTYAFGDAATVVDRESGKILMMNASGKVGFFGNGYLQVARSYSTDNGQTWTTDNATDALYQNDACVKHLFFSSGRMIQSTTVKKGDYYRIYAGVNTRIAGQNLTEGNGGSRVVYSDDFGQTWHYLGGIAAMPAPAGDECKVEELPNGNILLSCRTFEKGRYYNIYDFAANGGEGAWGSVVRSGETNVSGEVYGNESDGEVLIVPAKRSTDNKQMYVLLQSIPAAYDRTKVSIYWRALESEADYDEPSDFVGGWQKLGVSTTYSCYSTMVLDREGNVAFLYEEKNEEATTGYNIIFRSFPLESIAKDEATGTYYTYSPTPEGGFYPTSDPAWAATGTAVGSVAAGASAAVRVVPGEGSLAVTAFADAPVRVHTASGQLVASPALEAGQTWSVSVPQGVYLVNNQKVIVR